MNFAVVEKDFIREHILPDFDWVVNSQPSPVNRLRKSVAEARVAIVTTAGVHTAMDQPFDLTSIYRSREKATRGWCGSRSPRAVLTRLPAVRRAASAGA